MKDFSDLPPASRRRFLKLMGLALAAPAVPAAIRYAANDMVGQAHAEDSLLNNATYFVEINLRDQWDHGHVFIPPSLATKADLRRGERGRQAAIFFRPEELTKGTNGAYMTPDSKILAPHADSIAMIDCCELSMGVIHGHEAANALRSPGRDYKPAPGKMAMFKNDPVANFPAGVEAFYSSTPTPATLHNYVQKLADPSLRNGIAFKGISRSVHTAYHFAAGLPSAELDRIQSKSALFDAFPERVEDLDVVPTAKEAEVFVRILNRADPKFLKGRRIPTKAVDGHLAAVLEAQNLLHNGARKIIRMPLSIEEEAYWKQGVPDQACNPKTVKAQIWEQMAYAFKLISNRLTASVSLEFDYVDVHDERTPAQMATMTKQVCHTLARMIEQLKKAGIYERTLIAIYTTDGSRSPAAGSSGNEGKNTIILAGGMIKGGYYGDIRADAPEGDGHRYGYCAPDPTTGTPLAPKTDDSGRLPGSAVWRTVMKALKIGDDVCAKFPDVAAAKPLPFMLPTS
jgi:hypothetical protein